MHLTLFSRDPVSFSLFLEIIEYFQGDRISSSDLVFDPDEFVHFGQVGHDLLRIDERGQCFPDFAYKFSGQKGENYRCREEKRNKHRNIKGTHRCGRNQSFHAALQLGGRSHIIGLLYARLLFSFYVQFIQYK